MKNEVISYNTKKALAASLKKIMQKKPFSKITVREIIADCGVNRNTFYYHFEDIYALLRWMFSEEAIDVVKHFDLLVDYEEAIRFTMHYAETNDHIINCAYDSLGRDELKRFFINDFMSMTLSVIDRAAEKAHAELEPDFKEFTAKFYTEALAGLLIEWLKDKENRNTEQTVSYLCRIIEDSLNLLAAQAGSRQ